MNFEQNYGQLIFDLPKQRKNMGRYMWSIFTEATQFRLNDFPETPFQIHTAGFFPITHSFDDFIYGDVSKVALRYNLPDGLTEFRAEEPLACAFYLINSLHETLLPQDKWDRYGRYPYQESIQFAQNLMDTNYVQDIFEELFLNITGEPMNREKTQLIWSHDIDYLYSAWKSDLILAYRNRDFFRIPAILWKAMVHPHRWDNIEHILDLEDQYDIHSIYFWLTEQGKAKLADDINIDHADYSFQKKAAQKLWYLVQNSGSKNGLHKSAFGYPFKKELQKLPEATSINRNHFLKMQIPTHYDQIEKAGLKYDTTLGFPEHYGFRNSFGRPFQPYNLQYDRPYKFIEYPLHLMDTTMRTYLDMDLPNMMKTMEDFVFKHHNSCVISILLHNSQYDFRDKIEIELWNQFYSSLAEIDCTMPDKM